MTKDPQAAAPHVAHELRMLRRAWQQHQLDPLAYTAWFVHCRNLMNFYDNVGHPDEIKVSVYITGVETAWQTGTTGIRKPDNYDDYRGAVNKLAAHLTWDRTDPKWKNYPPSQEITEYLLGLSTLLLRVLPLERAAWFGGVFL